MIVFLILGAVVAAVFPPIVAKLYLLLVLMLISLILFIKIANRRCPISQSDWKFFWVYFAVTTIYMVCVYVGSPKGASEQLIEYISIFAKLSFGPLLFLCLPMIYKNRVKETSERILILYIIINFTLIIFQLFSGVETGNVIGGLHSNFMGLLGILAIVISLLCARLHKGWKKIYCFSMLIAVVTIILSLSRGAAVCAIAFLTILLLWEKGLIGKKTYRIYLVIILALLVAVIMNFSDWVKFDSAKAINEISESVTGKALDTGRSKLWIKAFLWFSESPIYGIGTEARNRWERELNDGRIITLSVHNYYLAVLVEAGIIGLFSVFFLLYQVLNLMIASPMVSGIGFSTFITVLLHQVMEVSLTTGSFTAGIIIWTTLSIVAACRFSSGAKILLCTKYLSHPRGVHLKNIERRSITKLHKKGVDPVIFE